jgi:hypothetical protein
MVAPRIKRDEHQSVKRAMAASSFFVPDKWVILCLIWTKLNNPFSSPMFTYTTGDWSTGYAAQPNGYDQTLHMASASASRVSFNLAGTFMSFGCDFRILTLQPLPLLSSSPLSRTVPPSYRSIPQTQFQHAQRDQPRHLPISPSHSIRFLWEPTRFTGM